MDVPPPAIWPVTTCSREGPSWWFVLLILPSVGVLLPWANTAGWRQVWWGHTISPGGTKVYVLILQADEAHEFCCVLVEYPRYCRGVCSQPPGQRSRHRCFLCVTVATLFLGGGCWNQEMTSLLFIVFTTSLRWFVCVNMQSCVQVTPGQRSCAKSTVRPKAPARQRNHQSSSFFWSWGPSLQTPWTSVREKTASCESAGPRTVHHLPDADPFSV